MSKDCYYKQLSACTCNLSPYCGKACVGVNECEQFIAEDEYFSRMIDGTLPTVQVSAEHQKKRQDQIRQNLHLEKSKKQLKREQKIEDEKNGVGTGYSLKDDPRFKGLFG